jgi:hypothetical protein
MNIRVAALAVVLTLVSGCNFETKTLQQPAMAIAPGYIRLDSGNLVQVIGYEKCPTEGYVLIGRKGTGSMEKHCTVVGQNSTDFEISVGTTKGLIVERWRVIADSSSIKLVRPNGERATVFVSGG